MDAEARLLTDVGRGDESALLALYDSLAPALMAFALHMTRSREDAEEVVQDTFVRLCEGASRFDPRLGSVRALAYTIARNLIRSRWRAASARPDVVDHDLSGASSWGATDPRPVQEARVLTRDALATLEPLDRALLEAAFLAGHSHGEVAERFDMPLGSVKSRLRRALLRLRDRWGASP
jgi:RNA polymerase sigma-70 factor, ECF subfamily